jgi:hypothetical protein
VAGEPQIVRLVRTLGALGCRSLTLMVRSEFAGQVRSVLGTAGVSGWRVVPCTTPSSLHTLAAGLAEVPAGPVFCTMVDTVMTEADWHRVWTATQAALTAGAELALAVTGFVDDESPVWVRRDQAGLAVSIGNEPVSPPCVSGGVYGLSIGARRLAAEAVAGGASRMRAFLRAAVERGGRVATVEVQRIIDLDRRRDLETASRWVESWEAEAP